MGMFVLNYLPCVVCVIKKKGIQWQFKKGCRKFEFTGLQIKYKVNLVEGEKEQLSTLEGGVVFAKEWPLVSAQVLSHLGASRAV